MPLTLKTGPADLQVTMPKAQNVGRSIDWEGEGVLQAIVGLKVNGSPLLIEGVVPENTPAKNVLRVLGGARRSLLAACRKQAVKGTDKSLADFVSVGYVGNHAIAVHRIA